MNLAIYNQLCEYVGYDLEWGEACKRWEQASDKQREEVRGLQMEY